MSTSNTVLFKVTTNQNTNLLSNKNYLQQKRKRENNFDKYNKFVYFKVKKPAIKSHFHNSPLSDKILGSKSVIRPVKKKKQIQSKINDFFTKSVIDESDMREFILNSYNEPSSLSVFDDLSSKKINNKKNKVDEITQTINKEKYDDKENNDISFISQDYNHTIDIDNHKIYLSEFPPLVNKHKFDYNSSINSDIFNKSEITSALKIQKEFNQSINDLNSGIDRIIKATSFFFNKGFNENIRYYIYKSLINNGFPMVEKFNAFYDNFINNYSKEKINIPDKMTMEFYIEYIFKLLTADEISISKNKLISDFFFNGENINIIKSNLNFINHFKDNNNSNNSRIFIQNYIGINYDKLFNDMSIKINNQFPKSKSVICRILSNIILECNKNGYLNYKKIINDDELLFNGLKIKISADITINYRKMISTRIFGQELSDKKFNNVIQEYFLELLSKFKI